MSETNKVLRGGKWLMPSDLISNGKYDVYKGSAKPLGKYDQFNRKGDTVIIVHAGSSSGSIAYSKENFWCTDGCFTLDHSEKYLNRFLYYWLKKNEKYLKSKVRKSAMPRIDKMFIEKISVPIISISEQQKIVDILDKFDTYTSDLTKCLPAEIELRKKQYEYYRDLLLSF